MDRIRIIVIALVLGLITYKAFAQGLGGASFGTGGGVSMGRANATFLRLDATNDPVTGALALSSTLAVAGNTTLSSGLEVIHGCSATNPLIDTTDSNGILVGHLCSMDSQYRMLVQGDGSHALENDDGVITIKSLTQNTQARGRAYGLTSQLNVSRTGSLTFGNARTIGYGAISAHIAAGSVAGGGATYSQTYDTGLYSPVFRAVNALAVGGPASGSATDIVAVIGRTSLTGNMDVTNMVALYGESETEASAGSVITNAIAIMAGRGDITGAGTITDRAGVVVAEQSGATNNTNLLIGTVANPSTTGFDIPTGEFNIYSSSTDVSYLAGSLGILDASPSAALSVGSGDLFTVDSAGNVTTAGNLIVDTNLIYANASTNVVGIGTTGGVTGPTIQIVPPGETASTITSSSSNVFVHMAESQTSGTGIFLSNAYYSTPTANSSAANEAYRATHEIPNTITYNVTGIAYALRGLMRHQGSGTATDMRAVVGSVNIVSDASGGTGTITYATGGFFYTSNADSGIMTYATSVYAGVASNTGAGSITYGTGVHIANQAAGGSTNNVNLLIGPNLGGNPTGSWSIYNTSTSNNYFAGILDFDFTDSSGTPGAVTQDKPSGIVAVAIGASSIVVTNYFVLTTSIVTAVVQQADATCTQLNNVIPANGSFTVNLNANCTAATRVGYIVFNN